MLRQKHGIREGSRLASMLIYLATGLCCIVTVYPMYYVLIRSVSAPEHAAAGDMLLFPKGLTLTPTASSFPTRLCGAPTAIRFCTLSSPRC